MPNCSCKTVKFSCTRLFNVIVIVQQESFLSYQLWSPRIRLHCNSDVYTLYCQFCQDMHGFITIYRLQSDTMDGDTYTLARCIKYLGLVFITFMRFRPCSYMTLLRRPIYSTCVNAFIDIRLIVSRTCYCVDNRPYCRFRKLQVVVLQAIQYNYYTFIQHIQVLFMSYEYCFLLAFNQ